MLDQPSLDVALPRVLSDAQEIQLVRILEYLTREVRALDRDRRRSKLVIARPARSRCLASMWSAGTLRDQP